jgi:hypothetical protein
MPLHRRNSSSSQTSPSGLMTELPYLRVDKDRHGNERIFVRRNGRNIRLRESPGTGGFQREYANALQQNANVDRIKKTAEAKRPVLASIKPRTLMVGWSTETRIAAVAVAIAHAYPKTLRGMVDGRRASGGAIFCARSRETFAMVGCSTETRIAAVAVAIAHRGPKDAARDGRWSESQRGPRQRRHKRRTDDPTQASLNRLFP